MAGIANATIRADLLEKRLYALIHGGSVEWWCTANCDAFEVLDKLGNAKAVKACRLYEMRGN